jgi:hypothetical protein
MSDAYYAAAPFLAGTFLSWRKEPVEVHYQAKEQIAIFLKCRGGDALFGMLCVTRVQYMERRPSMELIGMIGLAILTPFQPLRRVTSRTWQHG